MKNDYFYKLMRKTLTIIIFALLQSLPFGEVGGASITWEGGDAVYVARQMLNIEAEAINVDFAKAPPKPANIVTTIAKLYPNPAKDEVMVEFDNTKGNAVLEIFGFIGNLVQSTQLTAESNLVAVSIKDLKAGIYFYKITLNNDVVAKDKLLIVK